jgi:type IV secretion system protein VirD4
MTPDEVRMLDNRYALLFIRGERPVMDFKFDILKHPSVRLTTDGQADPYIHGEPWDAGSSIELIYDPELIAEAVANFRLIELSESSYEFLSEEDVEKEITQEAVK